MPRRRSFEVNPSEAVIDRLQQELYFARSAVLELIPEEARRILTGYYSCESTAEGHAWGRQVVEEVLALAKPLESPSPYDSPRAFCPLCTSGTSLPYESGFTLPVGLRRHLTGWGSVRQCSVMQAAMGLARECWRSRFAARDEAEAAQKDAVKVQRKATETLYRLGPRDDPELLDERPRFFATPRDEVELAWAEERLEKLGFEFRIEGRVRSYTKQVGEYCVYADPRARGAIDFRVYKGTAGNARRRAYYRVFKIQDAWKHDLPAKFEARLAEALTNY